MSWDENLDSLWAEIPKTMSSTLTCSWIWLWVSFFLFFWLFTLLHSETCSYWFAPSRCAASLHPVSRGNCWSKETSLHPFCEIQTDSGMKMEVHQEKRNKMKHFWTCFNGLTVRQWNCVLHEGGVRVVISLWNLQLCRVHREAHWQTLTSENKTQSTPLFALYDRSQHGAIFPACFAYDCRVRDQREEVMSWWNVRCYQEALERFYCTACTLYVYTSDARLTPCFRATRGNAGKVQQGTL